MSIYNEMLSTLDARETDLVSELKKVRTLRATVAHLAKNEPVTTTTTVGGGDTPPLMSISTSASPSRTLTPGNNFALTSRPPTLGAAAERVLREAGKHLHLKEIIASLRMTYWKDFSPGRLRASLTPTLRRRTDLFDSPRRGVYGLQAWKLEKAG